MPSNRRVVRSVPPVDPAQQAVVAFDGVAALVLGAPGTGKTTVALELVTSQVAAGAPPGSSLVLASSRAISEGLRDQLVRRLGATTVEPLSRTVPGLAFAVLRESALRHGEAMPQLLSGAEQDVVLRELLAGHREGVGRVPPWPDDLRVAVGTNAFRSALRELLLRAMEHQLTPGDLKALGERTQRPAWAAAGAVLQEYQEVMALARPGVTDPAGLCDQAAESLASDPQLAARWRQRLRCLIVDDAQELTRPAARLIGALVGGSTRLVVLADPDAATQGFRGADPGLPAELVSSVDESAPTFVLGTAWRQAGLLRAVTGAVAARIGTVGGVAHRRAEPVEPLLRPWEPRPAQPVAVVAQTFDSVSAQADFVAATLRRDHLLEGVPWSELAVITRTAAAADELRLSLSRRGVPVVVAAERPHLPAEPAVQPLLTVLGVAADLARGRIQAVPVELVEPLLRSAYGGLDALQWHRLLRTAGTLTPGDPTSPPEPVSDPLRVLAGWLVAGVPRPVARRYPGLVRIAAMITAARSASRWDSKRRRWDDGISVAGVVWAAWSAADLATTWRERARRQGARAAGADRDLDVVLALFDAAQWFDEHGADTGPEGFVDRLRGLDFTAEPLKRRGRRECVEVLTVHQAVGRAWRRVTVVELQDGIWPNPRLPGSLLGAEELLDALAGRLGGARPAWESLRTDEIRLFHIAVSRAVEALRVTAVDTETDAPSVLFRLVAAMPGVADGGPQMQGEGSLPARELSLGDVTARLRRLTAAHPDPRVRHGAARRLAALAAEQVPGADPATWWEPAAPSDRRVRRGADDPIRVSPSGLDELARCPLRWLTSAAGGRGSRPGGPARIGELVHEILATTMETSEEALLARLDHLWPEQQLAPSWLERRARGEAGAMLTRAARYLHQAQAQGRQEIARELPVTALIDACTVTARFDRVEAEPDGRLRIVDFKTGGTKPTADEVRRSPQLGAYQVALATRGHVAGATLVQLGRAANQQVTVQEQAGLADSDDGQWANRMIADSAATMSGSRFPARSGPWCRTCQVRPSCPAGGPQ